MSLWRTAVIFTCAAPGSARLEFLRAVPLPNRLALEIRPEHTPAGNLHLPGTWVRPSPLRKADAAVILLLHAPGWMGGGHRSRQHGFGAGRCSKAAEFALSIKGVTGAVIIKDDRLVACGELQASAPWGNLIKDRVKRAAMVSLLWPRFLFFRRLTPGVLRPLLKLPAGLAVRGNPPVTRAGLPLPTSLSTSSAFSSPEPLLARLEYQRSMAAQPGLTSSLPTILIKNLQSEQVWTTLSCISGSISRSPS